MIQNVLSSYQIALNDKGIDEEYLAQKSWYVKKWNVQGDDMKREHPSTWIEAFEAAILGIFYSTQFAKIRQERRISPVTYRVSLKRELG